MQIEPNPALPERPRWNSVPVKTEAAEGIAERAMQWARETGVFDESDPEETASANALIHLALIEAPDAYGAMRYLDDFAGWPVDDALMRIYFDGYHATRAIARSHVRAWVMANRVRFRAAKDDRIVFRCGEVEMRGDVLDVIASEARAVVKVARSGDLIGPLSVNAEDVMAVRPPRKAPVAEVRAAGPYTPDDDPDAPIPA